MNNCEIVQDLLPLYQDDICSPSSRKLVEEHLAGCAECTNMLQSLRNNEIDIQLSRVKDGVLTAHAKKERKITAVVGMVGAGVLMIPVIVCLICNIVLGHALDWFFIVLTALMVVASLAVVPLIIEKRRALITLCCFTVSLLLLLLTINIYRGESWFFSVAISILFALSVIFLPFALRSVPLPPTLQRHKGVFVMGIDTLLLYAVVITSGLHRATSPDWGLWLITTAVGIILPWAILLIFRYVKADIFTRVGLSVIAVGLYLVLINDIMVFLWDGIIDLSLRHVDFSAWGIYPATTGNIYTIILALALLIGGICCLIGRRRRKKNGSATTK